jgi:hypothetical protein
MVRQAAVEEIKQMVAAPEEQKPLSVGPNGPLGKGVGPQRLLAREGRLNEPNSPPMAEVNHDNRERADRKP